MRLTSILRFLAPVIGLSFIASSSYGTEWYDKILKAHQKEVFRIEVKWVGTDGTQCDKPVQGTGFLLSNYGRLVTATHVIEEDQPKANCSPQILAYPDAGSSTYYKAREIRRDKFISLIQLAGYSADTTITVSDSQLRVGDEVFYMGYPNETWTFKPGKFTNGNDDAGLFLVEMSSAPGSSGSPVFDKSGGVVGVIVGRPHENDPGQTHFFPFELASYGIGAKSSTGYS